MPDSPQNNTTCPDCDGEGWIKKHDGISEYGSRCETCHPYKAPEHERERSPAPKAPIWKYLLIFA